MPKIVLTDVFLSIGGTNLSTYVTSAQLTWEADEQETTTYGSGGARERLGGLKSGELSVEFRQDFAAGALDATIWPLVGTVAAFVLRPTAAAVSTSNPNYSGNVLITSWNPITGSVGDVASVSVSWPTTGPVTRATA